MSEHQRLMLTGDKMGTLKPKNKDIRKKKKLYVLSCN